jgi:hypothetical protein
MGAATSGRCRALRQRLLISMNFAVLASRSGNECRCALSQNLNSSFAQSVAMISGCDWDRASGNAGAAFIVCDDSLSRGGAAGSMYCVVVLCGTGFVGVSDAAILGSAFINGRCTKRRDQDKR